MSAGGWGGATPTGFWDQPPSSQRGRKWGESSQTSCQEDCCRVGKAWESLTEEYGDESACYPRFERTNGWGRGPAATSFNGGLHRDDYSPLMWAAANADEGLARRSFTSGSLAPTVETITNSENEAPISATRTQDSGSSFGWQMVGSRPRTTTLRSSSNSSGRSTASINYGGWAGVNPNQSTSQSSMTAGDSLRSSNLGPRFWDDGRVPSPSKWVGPSKDGWESEATPSRPSSKRPRDNWRKPTTPSKWEGQGGWN